MNGTYSATTPYYSYGIICSSADPPQPFSSSSYSKHKRSQSNNLTPDHHESRRSSTSSAHNNPVSSSATRRRADTPSSQVYSGLGSGLTMPRDALAKAQQQNSLTPSSLQDAEVTLGSSPLTRTSHQELQRLHRASSSTTANNSISRPTRPSGPQPSSTWQNRPKSSRSITDKRPPLRTASMSTSVNTVVRPSRSRTSSRPPSVLTEKPRPIDTRKTKKKKTGSKFWECFKPA